MAKIKIDASTTGTGTFTISAPNSNTDRTLTLPDTTSSLLTTSYTGDVNFNSGTLFVDQSTSRVGIGETSPDENLHIKGDNTFNSFASGPHIKLEDNDGRIFKIVGPGDVVDAYVGTTTNHILHLMTGGSSRLSIDTSGNVGIGTSSGLTSIAGFDKVVKFENTTHASYVVSGGTDEAEFGCSSNGGWLGTTTAIDMRFGSNNSTHMRLSSDGTLRYGTSDSPATRANATSGGGMSINLDAFSVFSRESTSASAAVMYVNQTGTNGDIITIRKDGADVGVIGNANSRIIITNGENHGIYIGTTSGQPDILPVVSRALTNNAGNLGTGSYQWKNLFLTGGVSFDGGSNYLDDYEEGTWTPVYIRSSSNLTSTTYSGTWGTYTKIGRVVHVSGRIYIETIAGSAGSGTVRISGLPFTVGGSNDGFTAALGVVFGGGWSSTNAPRTGFAYINQTYIQLYSADSSDARDTQDTPVTNISNGCGIIFNCVYNI